MGKQQSNQYKYYTLLMGITIKDPITHARYVFDARGGNYIKAQRISEKLAKRTIQQVLTGGADTLLLGCMLVAMEEEEFPHNDFSGLYKADTFSYKVRRQVGTNKHNLVIEIPWR